MGGGCAGEIMLRGSARASPPGAKGAAMRRPLWIPRAPEAPPLDSVRGVAESKSPLGLPPASHSSALAVNPRRLKESLRPYERLLAGRAEPYAALPGQEPVRICSGAAGAPYAGRNPLRGSPSAPCPRPKTLSRQQQWFEPPGYAKRPGKAGKHLSYTKRLGN